jgi:hypothetical protein
MAAVLDAPMVKSNAWVLKYLPAQVARGYLRKIANTVVQTATVTNAVRVLPTDAKTAWRGTV